MRDSNSYQVESFFPYNYLSLIFSFSQELLELSLELPHKDMFHYIHVLLVPAMPETFREKDPTEKEMQITMQGFDIEFVRYVGENNDEERLNSCIS
jgi:hypothetical protein